jgi:Mg2+/Co2+ transporter CorB|tara:strand:+ start:35 stop:298 length:264 start_codon:yes stop_codon:yes gene_type:complete
MSWENILKGNEVFVLYQTYEVHARDPYYTVDADDVVGIFTSKDKMVEYLERKNLVKPNTERSLEGMLSEVMMSFAIYTLDKPKEGYE